MTFNEAQLLLLQAKSPEAVFEGINTPAELKKAVRKIAAVVHPDANPTNVADAEVAFMRLTAWSDRATAKMKSGSWGDGKPSAERSMRTEKGFYEIHYLYRREALFDSMAATLNDEPVLVHVPRVPRYENLIRQTLASLQALGGGSTPLAMDAARLKDRLSYTTTRPPEGMVSLESVMSAHPAGMDLTQAVGYASGILRVLGKADLAHIVHGAINPTTVMVTPGTEACYLVDWHYSVPRGGVVEYLNSTYAHICPWEVRDSKRTDAGTDMAAVMMLLQEIIAPSEIPSSLLYLIRDHTVENRNRPADVNQCYRRLRSACK